MTHPPFGNELFTMSPTVTLAASLLMLLAACSGPKADLATQVPSSCMPGAAQVAFPLATQISHLGNSTPAAVPNSWDAVLSADQAQLRSLNPQSLIARNSDEIWMTGSSGSARYLLRYRPSTHQVFTYTVEALPGVSFVPVRLFQSRGGDLWGLGRVGVDIESITSLAGNYNWFLTKYNDALDRFEPVRDASGLLTAAYTDISEAESPTSVLWFIADGTLISYDPVSRQAQKVLDHSTGYTFYDLSIAMDGNVWLTGIRQDGDWEVVRYDPVSGDQRSYGAPPNSRLLTPPILFFDHTGRLWVGNTAWLEFSSSGDATWYEIIRPSIFVTKYALGEEVSAFGWSSANRIYESSNSIIWLTLDNGLATYNLNSEDWCLVYNGSAIVAEDDNGFLWIAERNQLYKSHL